MNNFKITCNICGSSNIKFADNKAIKCIDCEFEENINKNIGKFFIVIGIVNDKFIFEKVQYKERYSLGYMQLNTNQMDGYWDFEKYTFCELLNESLPITAIHSKVVDISYIFKLCNVNNKLGILVNDDIIFIPHDNYYEYLEDFKEEYNDIEEVEFDKLKGMIK